jgi:two-component system chemotaxis response regulator CheY
MRVLIVDDSKAMRMIVLRTLRQSGLAFDDVREAADGAEGLSAVADFDPQLVLSDWNMPNMTGIELLETLGAEGIKVKFGFVTTEATPDMRARAATAGARFLISKPFTPESFREALAAHIH